MTKYGVLIKWRLNAIAGYQKWLFRSWVLGAKNGPLCLNLFKLQWYEMCPKWSSGFHFADRIAVPHLLNA